MPQKIHALPARSCLVAQGGGGTRHQAAYVDRDTRDFRQTHDRPPASLVLRTLNSYKLSVKLGVNHSTSTIRKYVGRRLPPEDKSQRWLTFVNNHAKEMFACDFAVQFTGTFTAVYVFVVIEIGSRRIVHADVTTQPSIDRVKQQIREATPWGETPRWLIHDNDGIYGQVGGKSVGAKGRHYRCHLDRWLDEVMGIEWTPTP